METENYSYTETNIFGVIFYKNTNGNLHRTDGPAVELADGYKAWYLNGKKHRTDGPARELLNGSKEWYKDGLLHREDGPAIEYIDGHKEWYIDGKKLTEEEFNFIKIF